MFQELVIFANIYTLLNKYGSLKSSMNGGSLNHISIGPQSRIQHDILTILALCNGLLENGLK